MNILTSRYKIMSENLVKNLVVEPNGYTLDLQQNINNVEWSTFGIHITPNILFKRFASLNLFNFQINFDYELSKKDNIRIYNGISWIDFSDIKYSGHFNESVKFNFTNNYWRISTLNPQTKIKFKNICISIIHDELYNIYKSKKSILILGGTLSMCKDFEEDDKKYISTFSNNYLYYIKKYLIYKYELNVYNIEVSECDGNTLILEGLMQFDYCIDINQFGIHKKGGAFFKMLRPKINKKICSIYDNDDIYDQIFSEDAILCAIKLHNDDKFKCIQWAADEIVFKPSQSINEKIILIDDCHYNMDEKNDTYNILDYCINLLKTRTDVKIIRFGFYDEIGKFKDKYKNKIDRYEVIEHKLQIEQKALIHNKSHIFFCTHHETLGIPNIESAMAGCLLIYKRGFCTSELTNNLLKIEYDNITQLNNYDIFSKVDCCKQRLNALDYTWDKLVDRIYYTF